MRACVATGGSIHVSLVLYYMYLVLNTLAGRASRIAWRRLYGGMAAGCCMMGWLDMGRAYACCAMGAAMQERQNDAATSTDGGCACSGPPANGSLSWHIASPIQLMVYMPDMQAQTHHHHATTFMRRSVTRVCYHPRPVLTSSFN